MKMVKFSTLHEEDLKNKRKGPIQSSKYAMELRGLKPTERVKLLSRLEEARDKGLEPDQLIGETGLGKQLYERILTMKPHERMWSWTVGRLN
jgi:hypothetical protein